MRWFKKKNNEKQHEKIRYYPPRDINPEIPAYQVSDERFEYFVDYAYKQIPPKISKHIQNVSIVIDPVYNPRLLGLFQGVPKTKQLNNQGGHLPEVITLYRETLKSVTKTEVDLYEQTRKTLFHEIGHYLGMNHEKLGKHGY